MPKTKLLSTLVDLTLPSGLRPMTRDESMSFVKINFIPTDGLVTPNNFEAVPWANEPIVRILMARLKNSCVGDTPMDSRLPLWFALLSEGVPGNAVIWAYDTLIAMEIKAELNIGYDLTHWAERFATGVPTEATLSAFWRSQKTPQGGNLLDSSEAWS